MKFNTLYYQPKFNIAYIENPKVACTTIKNSLLDGKVEFERIHGPNLFPIYNNPHVPIFSIVRNPFTRIVSAYLNKIASNDDKYVKNLFYLKYDIDQGSDISFRVFLNLLKDTKNRALLDPHFRPQYLNLFHETITPSFIGYIEDMQSVELYLNQFNIKILTLAPHKTKSKIRTAELLNDENISLIKDIYADDFRYYGYDTDPYNRFNLKPIIQEQLVPDEVLDVSRNLDIRNFAELFRDSAIIIEKSNLILAKDLMSLAKYIRPYGPFINKKLAEYEDKLIIKNRKLSLLSTSNGLIKGGLSSSLAIHFELSNYSLGSSPAGAGLYTLLSNPEISNSDVIVVDYAINDNEHLTKDWMSEEHWSANIEELYYQLSLFNKTVVVLGLPVRSFIGRVNSHRGFVKHKELAFKYNFKFFDGYEFINRFSKLPITELFLDNAHLLPEFAFKLADELADVCNLVDNRLINENKRVSLSSFTMNARQFEGDFHVLRKGSTLIKFDFITLKESQATLNIRDNENVYLSGILIDANNHCKIKVTTVDNMVIKNIYSGTFAEQKAQFRYVPFYTPVKVIDLKIHIANYIDDVTEKSPGNNKQLNKKSYGEMDLVGLLFIDKTFSEQYS